MRKSGLVKELKLFDMINTQGVAADISHIDVDGSVEGYTDLNACLKGCEVVIICAGLARKPGMTRDDLFKVNAGIARDMAQACAKACPKSSILMVTNPVNSLVPVVAETLKKAGTYNPKKLFGITTLDVVRANTFLANELKVPVDSVDVPVIGGHAGVTILPLLSNEARSKKLYSSKIKALTKRIMFGGDEVVKAKALAKGGSATLSMAYAASVFACKLLRALKGEEGITTCAYVESSLTECPFFASPVTLGKEGIANIPPLPPMDKYEKELYDEMLPQLKQQCEKGTKFVQYAVKL